MERCCKNKRPPKCQTGCLQFLCVESLFFNQFWWKPFLKPNLARMVIEWMMLCKCNVFFIQLHVYGNKAFFMVSKINRVKGSQKIPVPEFFFFNLKFRYDIMYRYAVIFLFIWHVHLLYMYLSIWHSKGKKSWKDQILLEYSISWVFFFFFSKYVTIQSYLLKVPVQVMFHKVVLATAGLYLLLPVWLKIKKYGTG